MKEITGIGELSQYDGTELSIVVESTMSDGARACECMSTIDMSEIDFSGFIDPKIFYSVYVHLKTGGVDCAGDFDCLEDAQIYCHALDALLADMA